ncbi:MAG TPA: ABC transporter substrate-binding protein, partial [Nitrospirota bacterium]|nr:ABC transporter substrate-binding protein [Nitrospirota bacterium]
MNLYKTFLSIAAGLMLFATAAPAQDTIKVGAILAVTGPASNLGAPEARTLEMLVEDINAKGGIIGKKVELVIKDSGGSSEKAVSFAKQLIEEEKVFALIGPSTSGETMAIKNIAEEGKTILLSCAAAEVIVNPVAKYVFKVAPKDSFAVAKIFDEMNKMKIKKIGVLSSNTGFGKAGKEQLEKLAPESGIEIVISEVYDKSATDLTAEVTKLKAKSVQAIVNWSIEPAQSIVIKNARQIGLKVPIFQSHGFANIQYAKAAGAAAEGVIFPASRIVVADALPDKNVQKPVILAY